MTNYQVNLTRDKMEIRVDKVEQGYYYINLSDGTYRHSTTLFLSEEQVAQLIVALSEVTE